MPFDLVITGAGPAGTACAITAAQAGWRVALVERAVFPRHKVCGDCLNPSVWPVLEALGAAGTVQTLEHAPLRQVRFCQTMGRTLTVPLPEGAARAVNRGAFDQALLQAALAAGVVLFAGSPVTAVTRPRQAGGLWRLGTAAAQEIEARVLVAADGRNSTTCRLLGLTPPAPLRASSRRVALQCHLPLDPAWQNTVSLELTPWGYGGMAPIGSSRMNVCLVTTPPQLEAARQGLTQKLRLCAEPEWHSLTPLERTDLPPAPWPGCFLAGDAARVTEPFTGEGIYYALASGRLAAEAAGRHLRHDPGAAGAYQYAWQLLYRRRLWINRLTKAAVTHRAFGHGLLGLGMCFPALLQRLTSSVMAVPGGARP